ncbi:hypothetical protein [Mycolicibacterium palauense]|uniref:hypothetical protein n=1 Tax=Mycolicibacterium palauense TaxID=2034511 RepID=UPI000BFEEC2E|nr:hypothetical protein [Mycolicibacterium palauense]
MPRLGGPFRATEALDAGALTYRELRRLHTAVYPGVWMARDLEMTARLRARAAWLWSQRRGVLAGLSASAILGARWIDADLCAELIHTNRRPPRGITVHSDTPASGETRLASGMCVTTPARTAFDLGRRLPLVAGVQRVDALMNATGVDAAAIAHIAATHRGARGSRHLRETLRLVDGGAESPYESLTRILLVEHGFPKPETQIDVVDDDGVVFARIDMGWREYRVGVDFDGAHHWTDSKQRDRDVERYARLPELGWIDVRVTSGILRSRRAAFFERVGAALIARGCPRTW